MVLQGNLEEVALPDLLQVYCSGRQVARLTVNYSDAPDALFYVDSGDLVDAQFGNRSGVEAVWAALEKGAGAFRVEMGIKAPHRTIDQPWSAVVMEGMRRANETRAKRQAPPAPAPVRPLRAVSAPRLPAIFTPPAAPNRAGRATLVAGVAAAVLVAGGGLWYLLKGRPPAPTAAPAPTVKAPLTLGMSVALSGPSKELGRQMKLGVDTALAVANEAGGVAGRKLELVALDDGYEPARTKEAMKELIEVKKVFAVI
ncbi:MAG: ABC transporter substrate-binding protein, partial [Thermoanaerobaculia bacterium]